MKYDQLIDPNRAHSPQRSPSGRMSLSQLGLHVRLSGRKASFLIALLLSPILSLFVIDSGSAQEQPEGSVRVMSFNIRFNNPNDGPNAWPHRKEIVAGLIRDNELDMFGLQEALPVQVAYLKESLPEFDVFGAGRDDGKSRGEQVPIFYRRDRWQLLENGHFWLSETPDVPGSKSWDTAITRMATWVKLRDKSTGQSVFYVNTHYDHIGQEARRQSAVLMKKHLPELAGELPIVLTGDFNCRDDSPPYKVLTQTEDTDRQLRDAREICTGENQGPNSTWSGFSEVEDGKRIDFVFVDPQFKVKTHHILDQTFDDRFPSDHLPVVVTLEFANE